MEHYLWIKPEEEGGIGCISCTCGWNMGYPTAFIHDEEALAAAKIQHDRPKIEGGA